MTPLFLYGTLCHRPLLERVLGPEAGGLNVTPARLAGHAVRGVHGAGYPMIVPEDGAVAEGVLVRGLTPAAVARLDYYEGGHLYELRDVSVQAETGAEAARAYFPAETGGMTPGGPWDLATWAARWGEITTLAAEEVMEGYGTVPAADFLRRYPSILARAASRVRARAGGPATLRRRAEPGDVRVTAHRRPYAAFFSVEEYDLTHRRFDGTMSPPLTRAAFVANDAVTVLPYDPARDRVLLVEQFRMGPYARGDGQPWSLEAIAGRVDAGETPEEAARREAREEAGLAVGPLHHVAGYYVSPGAKTEYLNSYVALTDLPDGVAGLGGLDSEHEDIRGHLQSFAEVRALLRSGELQNAPLILTVLWLEGMRDRLRAGA